MGKYLHKFNSVTEFENDYDDVDGTFVKSFNCSKGTFAFLGEGYYEPRFWWKSGDSELWTYIRNPEVNEYARDRADNEYRITGVTGNTSIACAGYTYTYDRFEWHRYEGQWNGEVYSWTNGEEVLCTNFRNPMVGAYDQEGHGAWRAVDEDDVTITSISTEGHSGKYHEPWVSKTNNQRILARIPIDEYDPSEGYIEAWLTNIGEYEVVEEEVG